MDTELKRIVRSMIRKGTVCAVDPKTMSVKVEFSEKDCLPSPFLPVLCQGAGGNKCYWLPDIGDQVVCLYEANDKNASSGWVLGTYFTEAHPPQVADAEIRRLDFGDGSFMEFNRSNGSLTIQCTGNIVINGKMIYLN
ncbi:MAG: phage baseplate assembly protein V [Anaerovibrio sp.]|nr:phage baseplate assembly protein V [Anaerovibrio sp.]